MSIWNVWSYNSPMNSSMNRRHVLTSSLGAFATLGGATIINGVLDAPLLGAGADRFNAILQASTGAVASNFNDFAVQSPEGNTCTARLAYPMAINRRLPVIVFCPDEGAQATQYDLATGALAAQGYFVMAVDRRPASTTAARRFQTPEQQEDERLRRFAETRFLLDTIDAAAAALGANADMMDTSRMGAMGHGEGAWLAAGLGGWDQNGAPNTRTRDGRIHAVFGLAPKRMANSAAPPAQRSPDGVSGMFAGILSDMPTPARNSGLLGLSLPIQSNSFGGLIGSNTATTSRRLTAEPQALAAAMASAVLFFDWTLRGSNSAKRELMSLNGRQVPGLNAPLQLRKA
jgi:hypothetical protein